MNSTVLRWLGALLALAAACSRVDPPRVEAAPPAQRIVPASATAVDLASALAEPARFAAIPEQALEYSALHDSGSPWSELPRFSAYLAEPVLALRPDLVIADPWQAPETTQRLREFGVRVLALPETDSWESARAALELVARELGSVKRGRELVAELDERVRLLRERASRRAPLRAMAYSNFGGAGSTAGAGTTIHSMMERGGLRNLIAERGSRGHAGVAFEELLALDPDVIVVSRPLKMAEGPAGDRGGASEKLLYGEPSLAQLRAVRERRVVALPAWLFATSSHELVRGAEALEVEIDALARRLAEVAK
jgi:iron complex transport system substrate-binding protein